MINSFEDTCKKRVKELREKLNYNQATLAKKADITPAAMSQIENGLRVPSTPVLLRLAIQLRTTTDYLLGLNDTLYEKVVKPEADMTNIFIKENLHHLKIELNIILEQIDHKYKKYNSFVLKSTSSRGDIELEKMNLKILNYRLVKEWFELISYTPIDHITLDLIKKKEHLKAILEHANMEVFAFIEDPEDAKLAENFHNS